MGKTGKKQMGKTGIIFFESLPWKDSKNETMKEDLLYDGDNIPKTVDRLSQVSFARRKKRGNDRKISQGCAHFYAFCCRKDDHKRTDGYLQKIFTGARLCRPVHQLDDRKFEQPFAFHRPGGLQGQNVVLPKANLLRRGKGTDKSRISAAVGSELKIPGTNVTTSPATLEEEAQTPEEEFQTPEEESATPIA